MPASKINLGIEPPTKPEVESASAADESAKTSVDDVSIDDVEVPASVDESVVRGLLSSFGSGAGYLLGDEDVPNHWRFTNSELDDLTPPVTRIVNRRAKLRRAVMRGDEATVGIVLAGYMGRNTAAGHKAKEKRKHEDQQREAHRASDRVATGARGQSAVDSNGGRGSSGVPSTESGSVL